MLTGGVPGTGWALRSPAGGVAQPAATINPIAESVDAKAAGRRAHVRSEAMGWVLLEAGVALLLAIAIVWWVMRQGPSARQESEAGDRGSELGDRGSEAADRERAITDPKGGRNE